MACILTLILLKQLELYNMNNSSCFNSSYIIIYYHSSSSLTFKTPVKNITNLPNPYAISIICNTAIYSNKLQIHLVIYILFITFTYILLLIKPSKYLLKFLSKQILKLKYKLKWKHMFPL